MAFYRNSMKYILHKCLKHSSLRCSLYQNPPNLMNFHPRNFSTSSKFFVKTFIENENQYAYEVMKTIGYVAQLNNNFSMNTPILPNDEFHNIICRDWSKEASSEIFRVFPLIASYCSNNNVCISDAMFDNYIDNLADNLENSTDEELKSHFFTLSELPETPSIRTRNYVEIWAALDVACLNRYKDWTYDEVLLFCALFYKLNATKASDFCYKAIQRLTYRVNKLTKSQLVQCLFFIAAMRFSPNDMHGIEVAVEKYFDEFSIDELAIVSMGFFKSKVPIRSISLVINLIDRIIENASTINEVTLAALLKVIRFSRKIPVDDKLCKLLDNLESEIARLSVMCNVHIALLASSSLTFHEGCFLKIANAVLRNMPDTRLKDIERLVLSYGTFNSIQQIDHNLIDKVIEELRKADRQNEIHKHGRSYACCVAYLGLLGYYPFDLMATVFNKTFLEKTYGKYCMLYGREILTLHNLVKIFHKDKSFETLTDKEALILAKKYTDYLPDENYPKKYNLTDKMYLDVKKVIEQDRGTKYVVGHHILTHHQRGDIIICTTPTGSPCEVLDVFEKFKFGRFCPAPNDGNTWTALVIAGRNTMLYNSDTPNGHVLSKIRELNALGYKAAPVCWTNYSKCKSYKQKLQYINHIIKEA